MNHRTRRLAAQRSSSSTASWGMVLALVSATAAVGCGGLAEPGGSSNGGSGSNGGSSSASSSGASGTSGSPGGGSSTTSGAPQHPPSPREQICQEVGPCGAYVEHPDGSVERLPGDGGIPAGGIVKTCGSCNG